MPLPLSGQPKKRPNQFGIPLLRRAPSWLKNGLSWYDTVADEFRFRLKGRTWPLWLGGINGFIGGNPPTRDSVSQVRIPAGFVCDDDTGRYQLRFTVDQLVSLASSGAGGLDTGAEASNTWYYLWAIGKSSDGSVSAVFSTSFTSPTLPAGFDLKRRIPSRWKNDGSSNLENVECVAGWPYRSEWEYRNTHINFNGSINIGAQNLVNNGTPALNTPTLVDCSNYVPPNCRRAKFVIAFNMAAGGVQLRENGQTQWDVSVSSQTGSSGGLNLFVRECGVNAAREIQWQRQVTTSGVYIELLRYILGAD